MCKCILSSCVCKTKPQGLPSCLPKFKMCLRVRMDSCVWLYVCACSVAGNGELVFWGLALLTWEKGVYVTPEPLLHSDIVWRH